MQEYWNMISNEHQQRLIILAEKLGIDIDTAMKNIINCLQGGDNLGEYYLYCMSPACANQIEEMIDTMTA